MKVGIKHSANDFLRDSKGFIMTVTKIPFQPQPRGKTAQSVGPATLKDEVAVSDVKSSVPVASKSETVDPWADVLVGSTLAVPFVRGPLVDVERDVPATLRQLFELSLKEYGLEVVVNERPHPDGGLTCDAVLAPDIPKFREFDCGTVERAQQFVDFAKKYAKYRVGGELYPGQVSVRAFCVTVDKKSTSVVRFAFLPLVKRETRRAPGTVTEGSAQGRKDAAKVREWAKANGHAVADRGRLGPEIYAAYDEAHKPAIPGSPEAELATDA